MTATNQLYADFLARRSLQRTPSTDKELEVVCQIYSASRSIDSAVSKRTDSLNSSDPLWALLHTMLVRVQAHVEAAIVSYCTGSVQSSEVLSRVAIEAAINVIFIIADARQGSRLSQYFAHYFQNEERELDKWEKAASKLSSDARRINISAAASTRSGLPGLQLILDKVLSEVGLPVTRELKARWPNVAERFTQLGLELDYRTVYAALSSQVHNDAEDLLNALLGPILNDALHNEGEILDRISGESRQFSRMLLYVAADYYLMAASGYVARFGLDEATAVVETGRAEISLILASIVDEKARLLGVL